MTYPSIGQEAFAVQKPQVYVFIVYKGTNPSQLASYLFSTYPNTPASKQHRIVTVNASQWNAGIFLPVTIEQLARAFHPEVF
jgi:ABC-type Fe3+-hydroxamate transport system substrate-binding protein